MPGCFEYLWQWFLRLNRRRGGALGPTALTWQDLQAFFNLSGMTPTPWEVEQLEALDNAYLESQDNRKMSNAKKTPDGDR